MAKSLNNENKPMSMQERWESDKESRYYMLKNNPPKSPPLTKEERERYKKEFGVILPEDKQE